MKAVSGGAGFKVSQVSMFQISSSQPTCLKLETKNLKLFTIVKS
jgi:hypothetical protein